MSVFQEMSNVSLALYYAEIGDREALVELKHRDELLERRRENTFIEPDKHQMLFDFVVVSSSSGFDNRV